MSTAVQPGNYCRQILKQAEVTGFAHIDAAITTLCATAHKFALPDGEWVLPVAGDNFFARVAQACADGGARLPFAECALEFVDPSGSPLVYLAQQRDDGRIRVRVLVRNGERWVTDWTTIEVVVPTAQTAVYPAAENKTPWTEAHTRVAQKTGFITLVFLLAVMCSNARVETIAPRKPAKRATAALPFDTYHVLTIDPSPRSEATGQLLDASRRSPREHLRRGHVVMPKSGRPFWRNATVVNAGRTQGRVDKDYRIASGAHA